MLVRCSWKILDVIKTFLVLGRLYVFFTYSKHNFNVIKVYIWYPYIKTILNINNYLYASHTSRVIFVDHDFSVKYFVMMDSILTGYKSCRRSDFEALRCELTRILLAFYEAFALAPQRIVKLKVKPFENHNSF